MAKKEMDKLSQDMMQCKKDGYGCNYGKWKALQENPLPKKKKDEIPEGWKVCKRCGNPFKPKTKNQSYCEYVCQRAETEERRKAKHLEVMKRYRERKKAERMQANEQ